MPPPDTVRVLLVDDHPTMLWGLEHLINGERPRMEVAATASHADQALALATITRVDVVLLDLDLGADDGGSLIARFNALPEPPAVVVFTANTDPAMHRAVALAGARGVVTKKQPAEVVIKAIERTARGELWLERALSSDVIQALRGEAARARATASRDPLEVLTGRERQVTAAVTARPGASGKALAQELGISEHTLRNHLAAVYAKLGVSSRLELLDWAHRNGLGRPDEPV